MAVTFREIAEHIGARLQGDPDGEVTHVAPLHTAKSGDLSFLANRKYHPYLKITKASVVVLAEADAANCPVAKLITDDPYLAYVKAVRYLRPPEGFQPHRHPTAVVDDSSPIPPGCYIGAHAVVGRNVSIGEHVHIGAGSVIDENVVVGASSYLHANVTLCAGTAIGERVLIHPGVVIGADGFGIANDGGRWLKIPQLGGVVIGDDVEIGANTTIDKGALQNTIIEDGVKIDNQVQIGHNVRVGAHTAIAGATGIAGSVTVGKRCMIGGASAINGHLEIADDVVITGMSGVTNSIKEAGVYSAGVPVVDNKTWRRNVVRFKHLDKIVRRLFDLERRIKK